MAESFARATARRRHELKLTQQQLAERAGVHRATIRAAEHGDSVSPLTASRIRSALDGTDSTDVTAELEAIGQIVAAMNHLDSAAQRRTLAYVNARFGGAL